MTDQQRVLPLAFLSGLVVVGVDGWCNWSLRIFIQLIDTARLPIELVEYLTDMFCVMVENIDFAAVLYVVHACRDLQEASFPMAPIVFLQTFQDQSPEC